MALTLTLLLISLIAIATAKILGSLQLPGYRILSGLLIGILLGPSILGRIAPTQWESTFAGGIEARSALRDMDRSHAAWVLASRTVGSKESDISEEQIIHEVAREELLELEEIHRRRHQTPWMVITLILAALTSTCASRNPSQSSSHTPLLSHNGISPGVWFSAIPLWGLFFLPIGSATTLSTQKFSLLRRPFRLDHAHWALEKYAIARWRCPTVINGLPHVALTATVVSAIVVGCAAFQSEDSAWLIVAIILLAIPRRGWSVIEKKARSIDIESLVVPPLAAMSIVMSELVLEWMFIPTVAICILGGDGRWLGAVIGVKLRGGATMNQAYRIAFSLLETTIPQLTITAAAAACGVIDGTWTLALLTGLAVVEISRPARRWMEGQLISTEE